MGDRGKYDDKYYFVKGNAAGVIDEIAQVSSYHDSEPPKKIHQNYFAKYGFDYRTAYFEDLDGKYYRLRISVGINENNKEVYNIGRIKELGSKPRLKLKGHAQSAPNSNRISQNEGKSKSSEKKSVGDIDELINGQYDEYEEEIRILETEKKY